MPVIAAVALGAALKGVAVDTLLRDGQSTGADDAVSAVDALPEASNASTPVVRAGARLEEGRLFVESGRCREGGEREEVEKSHFQS